MNLNINKYIDTDSLRKEIGHRIDILEDMSIKCAKNDYEEMKHYHPEKDNGFSSPEEACEEAIKYCLENLIVSNTNSGTATAKAEG